MKKVLVAAVVLLLISMLVFNVSANFSPGHPTIVRSQMYFVIAVEIVVLVAVVIYAAYSIHKGNKR